MLVAAGSEKRTQLKFAASRHANALNWNYALRLHQLLLAVLRRRLAGAIKLLLAEHSFRDRRRSVVFARRRRFRIAIVVDVKTRRGVFFGLGRRLDLLLLLLRLGRLWLRRARGLGGLKQQSACGSSRRRRPPLASRAPARSPRPPRRTLRLKMFVRAKLKDRNYYSVQI